MIDIDVDTAQLELLFDKFLRSSQNINEFTGEALDWLGERLTIIMKETLEEISFSGRLIKSVGHEVSGNKDSVEVGPNVPAMTQDERKVYTVWKGSEKEFSPPLQELKNWAQVKLGDSNLGYYLQKRIAGKIPDGAGGFKKGGISRASGYRETPGFSFPERTLDSPETQILFQEVGDRIGKEVIGRVIGAK